MPAMPRPIKAAKMAKKVVKEPDKQVVNKNLARTKRGDMKLENEMRMMLKR